jgi:Acyl-CoA carboxylase epsilon subunit
VTARSAANRQPGADDLPTIRVLKGEPSPEEVVALVVALTALCPVPDVAPHPEPAGSQWTTAPGADWSHHWVSTRWERSATGFAARPALAPGCPRVPTARPAMVETSGPRRTGRVVAGNGQAIY